MDGSGPFTLPPQPFVTTANPEAIGHAIAADATPAPASGAWPASGTAILVPVTLTQPVTVRNLFWHNGATASGALDCGLYDANFVRLLSTGSQQQQVVNALQTMSVTATVIPQGQCYLALSATGSVTVFRWSMSLAEMPQVVGVLTAASAFPLPATITASGLTTAVVPLFGFASRTLVTS